MNRVQHWIMNKIAHTCICFMSFIRLCLRICYLQQ